MGGREFGGRTDEPPGGIHIDEREAKLLETIRGAEDPAGVMATVLETIFELLPPSGPPDPPCPSAPGSEGGTTQ